METEYEYKHKMKGPNDFQVYQELKKEGWICYASDEKSWSLRREIKK